MTKSDMTESERIQYERFLAAGYDPGLAADLISRGAWLQVGGQLNARVAEDVRRYRAERDAPPQDEINR